MKILILSLFAFLVSAQSGAVTVYERMCVSYNVEFVNCFDYGKELQFYDLIPYSRPEDFIPQKKEVRTEMQVNGSVKAGISPKDPNHSPLREYGEGIAYGFTAFFQQIQQMEYDAQLVKDNFLAVHGKVAELNAEDQKEIDRAYNSAPRLREKFDETRRTLRSDINDKLKEFDDLDRKLDEVCASTVSCGDEQKPDAFEPEQTRSIDYKLQDKLLTQKRNELLKRRDSSKLPAKTIDNICYASGVLQQEANEAFAKNDVETASAGQSVAMGLVNFGLDLVPVVSDMKGLYEGIFGENPITGEKLDATDRVISAASSLIGIATFGTLGAATKTALKSARLLEKIGGAKAAFDGSAKLYNAMGTIGVKTVSTAKDFLDSSIGRRWSRRVDSNKHPIENGFKIFDQKSPLSNPFPEDGYFARVLPREAAEKVINGEGYLSGFIKVLDDKGNVKEVISETFITAAEDLKGIKGHESIAKRLALYEDEAGTVLRNLKNEDSVIVKFKFKDEVYQSIRTPIEIQGGRKYGFEAGVPGGRTGGQAREWLVNNDIALKGYLEDIQIVPIE